MYFKVCDQFLHSGNLQSENDLEGTNLSSMPLPILFNSSLFWHSMTLSLTLSSESRRNPGFTRQCQCFQSIVDTQNYWKKPWDAKTSFGILHALYLNIRSQQVRGPYWGHLGNRVWSISLCSCRAMCLNSTGWWRMSYCHCGILKILSRTTCQPCHLLPTWALLVLHHPTLNVMVLLCLRWPRRHWLHSCGMCNHHYFFQPDRDVQGCEAVGGPHGRWGGQWGGLAPSRKDPRWGSVRLAESCAAFFWRGELQEPALTQSQMSTCMPWRLWGSDFLSSSFHLNGACYHRAVLGVVEMGANTFVQPLKLVELLVWRPSHKGT